MDNDDQIVHPICELEKLDKVRQLAEMLGFFVEKCCYTMIPPKLPEHNSYSDDGLERYTEMMLIDKNRNKHYLLEKSNNEAKDKIKAIIKYNTELV